MQSVSLRLILGWEFLGKLAAKRLHLLGVVGFDFLPGVGERKGRRIVLVNRANHWGRASECEGAEKEGKAFHEIKMDSACLYRVSVEWPTTLILFLCRK